MVFPAVNIIWPFGCARKYLLTCDCKCSTHRAFIQLHCNCSKGEDAAWTVYHFILCITKRSMWRAGVGSHYFRDCTMNMEKKTCSMSDGHSRVCIVHTVCFPIRHFGRAWTVSCSCAVPCYMHPERLESVINMHSRCWRRSGTKSY